MTIEDVLVPTILETVIGAMKVQKPGASAGTFLTMNYAPGNNNQILKALSELDGSITLDGLKYPLVAVKMPIFEKRGRMFYAEITIPRIVFATLVKVDEGDVLPRFKAGGTFKEILYPMYKEFLKRLAMSPNVNCSDPDAFEHIKSDWAGDQPTGKGTNDYIDFIEISDLKLNLIQIQKCKT